MITYYKGTVFNTDAQTIVNTVNCDGFMGGGIALEFGLRYPELLENYQSKCKNHLIVVGKVDYFRESESLTIINFPTKLHFRYPSNIRWVEDGLKDFVNTYKENNIKSVAFPKLGTSNGGLDWNSVQHLMEQYLSHLDIDVTICLDELGYAEGIEKKMIDSFNEMSVNDLAKNIRLNAKQQEALNSNKPYNRFWKIGKTQSIGKVTYANLFRFFYNNADNENMNAEEQISMF